MVYLDILVRIGNEWFGYEVKSSVKISNVYLLDAALQYYVLKRAGIMLADISIVTINTDYVFDGKLDVHSLFKFTSVKANCEKQEDFIASKSDELKNVVELKDIPFIEIGAHCNSPYPCDFKGTCWKHVPFPSVFNLSAVPQDLMMGWYGSGILRVDDIPEKDKLPNNIRIQIDSLLQNTSRVLHEEIRSYLAAVDFPCFFLDIESIMPAIPRFKGTTPYHLIPFLFCVYKQESQREEAIPYIFIGEANTDWREDFIKHLIVSTEGDGKILVYDVSSERKIINQLIKDFPFYTRQLEAMRERLFCLRVPFEKMWYYHPKMYGSHTLKSVLPVLCPEMNHNQLTINSGIKAINAFEELNKTTDIFKIAELHDLLTEYCKYDTLALVKILAGLQNMVK